MRRTRAGRDQSGDGLPGQGSRPNVREAEYAARWANGWWRGRSLRTAGGDRYTVIYQGRRGGGAGPDFRDAVLARPDGTRIHGDVELHLRASGWREHGHETDTRYAGVVLHIVFTPLPSHAGTETPLPLGGAAPIAVLDRNIPSSNPAASSLWPCARLAQRLGGRRLRELLLGAGHARFTQHEARFHRDIATAEAEARMSGATLWTPRDRVLFVAIAEGLGYGRDRYALRAAGEALLTGAALAGACNIPLVTGRIEQARLDGLIELRERWLAAGPWSHLARSLALDSPHAAVNALAAELRIAGGRVSLGRASILTANVVLPFASAVGALSDDETLRLRARSAYDAMHGLPSNAITRLIARQFGLARLPAGAATQQGLQHIWSEWCREKRCDFCPCAGAGADPGPDVPSPDRESAESATLTAKSRPTTLRRLPRKVEREVAVVPR